MSRQDQYAVTVVVGGRNLGIFDKFDGGGMTSETTKYRPGNMGAEITLGGYRSVDDITVSRLYVLTRDHPQMGFLMGNTGKADVTVIKQPLDANGNVFGSALVYRGSLQAVTPPPADSESSDAALLELVITSAQVST